MKQLIVIALFLCVAVSAQASKVVTPSPTGHGTYAELGEDAGFENITVDGITSKSNIEYEYPEIPFSPVYVLPFRSDLLPTSGAENVVFARTSKASWTDYDGILRWSTAGTPRFTNVRLENGSPKTTTTDGRLIPDDPSYFGTILFVGDSQCAGVSEFPHRMENMLKGTTTVNTCVGGQTLATIASEIVARLQTYSPDMVIIEGGINDIIAGTASATMLGYVETISSACIQYGAEPILIEVTPAASYASMDAGKVTVLGEFNAGISIISGTYGYKLVKLHQIFEDPTTPDDLNPSYDNGDGLHWSSSGQKLATSEILNVINPVFIKGLLVERAMWNRAVWSQAFDENDAGEWIESNVTTTGDSTEAPDLTITADTITASAANGTLLQTYTIASADFCFSIWLKRETGTGTVYITIDGGTTLTAVNVSDTWRRFWVTKEAANPVFGVQIATNTDAVYAYGGQLETGTYPTSYFPTDDTVGGLERAADVAYLPTTGLDIAETSKVFTAAPLWSTQDLFDISGTEKAHVFEFQDAPTEKLYLSGKSFQYIKYTAAGGLQNLKLTEPIVGRVSTVDTEPFIAKVGLTSSLSSLINIGYADGATNSSLAITDFKAAYGNNVYIGSDQSEAQQFNGHIKNFIIYNSALSADQMHEVTSW